MKRHEIPAPEIDREPSHPGEVLDRITFPALGLTVADAAAKLGVSRQTLYNILQGKAGVTTEMAMRLGKLCGNGPDLWLNLQRNYDLWHLRRKLAAELEQIPTLAEV